VVISHMLHISHGGWIAYWGESGCCLVLVVIMGCPCFQDVSPDYGYHLCENQDRVEVRLVDHKVMCPLFHYSAIV